MQYKNLLFKIYSSLFIFMTINREFKPFNFDLRFLILILSVVLIFSDILNIGKVKSRITKYEIFFLVFYFVIFLSNIAWLYNGLHINLKDFFNQMILHTNNLLFICVCILNKEKVNIFEVLKIFKISVLILLVSQLALMFNISLNGIMSTDYPGFYQGGEHYNLFMQNIRYAGFAQDPNYACLFFSILTIMIIFYKYISLLEKIGYLIICGLGISLSFSRTMVLGLFLTIVSVILLKKILKINIFNKNIDKVFFIVPFMIAIVVYVIINNISTINLLTMQTRFSMWQSALELFMENPILGNGITSFREYYLEKGHWYVQSHSTILQILSETGIIGLTLYSCIYKLIGETKNVLFYGLIILLTIFSINFEMIYLQIFPLVFMMLKISLDEKKYKDKKVLFFVNSLGQGGAERVCINMADIWLNQGYDVEFVCLYNNKTMLIDKRIELINLDLKKAENKLLRIIDIFKAIYNVNNILKKKLVDTEYVLVTSHLPFSNLLSYLSIFSSSTLYVMHLPCSKYEFINSKIYGIVLRLLFIKRKIVCVSNGIKTELIEKYKLSDSRIKTIYNPIDLNKISKLKNENIDNNNKYLLAVGRLTKQKRFDRLIEIYYKGNFYRNFDLIILGDGEEKDNLINIIKKYKLEDKVLLKGFESNVYKWMKNAEVYILTSDNEGFPMVLLEALASGTKVVAANCEYGPSEILIGDYSYYLVNNITSIDEYIKKINDIILECQFKRDLSVLEKCKDVNVIKEYFNFYQKEV